MDRRAGPVVCALLTALALGGCGGDGEAGPTQISVSAEVVEADAPVDVEATAVVPGREQGWFEHGVRVTWRGDGEVNLDDARFVHRVDGEDGDLITLGRGCGWSLEPGTDELVFPCTADFQIIVVEPGVSHTYSVSIPVELESFRIGRGTFVLEEEISWWVQEEIGTEPTDEGQFTVRLTYVVD